MSEKKQRNPCDKKNNSNSPECPNKYYINDMKMCTMSGTFCNPKKD